MQPWEFVVIAVGAVLIGFLVYAVTVLKKLSDVLDSADELIKTNTGKINGIIDNLDTISEKVTVVSADAVTIASETKTAAQNTRIITSEAKGAVTAVKNSIGKIKDKVSGSDKTPDTFANQKINKIISAAGTALAIIRVFKNRRMNRQIKKLRKEANNK
ncbi:MAG: hypothetical protein GX061_08070 [Eubacteriaceae bacterium]|nr:hypothetical protein [Eubacteriaceae bacterium]